jgi:FkbM family methyltransferase
LANEVLQTITTDTPNNSTIRLQTRATTNDAAVAYGILGTDEYGLQGESISGWVIDIGAHIGIVCIAIALDFPDTKIVAVEAIPDNAALVQKNVDLNGLHDRIFVESAAATEPGLTEAPIIFDYEWVGVEKGVSPVIEEGYVRDCRYIGNIFEYPEGEQRATTLMVPALSLGAIMQKYAIDEVELLKLDCEGCEYAFLRDPARKKVRRIIGEFHRGFPGIEKLLGKTHNLTVRIDRGGVGIFEANRR